MTVARPHRSGIQKESHVQGWLVSVLLHGTLALIAIILVTQIQLSPQNEPFKWNVAMVSPTQPVTPTTSPPNQAPTPIPPGPSAAPPTPSSSLQRNAAAQPPPSPQPLTQQTTPSISERPLTPVVTEPRAPASPQPTTLSQSAVHTAQPVEPIKHEPVAPRVAEPTSTQKPAEAPTAIPPISDPLAMPSPPPSTAVQAPAQMATNSSAPPTLPATIPEPATQSDAALPDSAPAQLAAVSPTPSNAPTKRDYGWLSEAILRRVEELKRYPASARADRAEGKVVVKAVINEDGSIGEMEVFQSSGHPSLDKAAMETMRQAAPFHLPRPLGQPRMTIKIPMSYRLDK